VKQPEILSGLAGLILLDRAALRDILWAGSRTFGWSGRFWGSAGWRTHCCSGKRSPCAGADGL